MNTTRTYTIVSEGETFTATVTGGVYSCTHTNGLTYTATRGREFSASGRARDTWIISLDGAVVMHRPTLESAIWAMTSGDVTPVHHAECNR